MSEPIAHHFVPQHLQRNFANEPEDSLSVFDVQTGKTFETGSSVLMQRGHFHTLMVSDGKANFEEVVTAIENQAVETLNQVVRDRRLSLKEDEKNDLSILVAFQELRTSRFRNQLVRIGDELRGHAERLGAKSNEVDGWLPKEDNLMKATHLRFMFEQFEGFARIIKPRTFLLAEPTQGRSLYLGDSPVVRHNDEPKTFYSGTGFASKGLQIYMPLARDLMLGIWDPELFAKMQDNIAEARRTQAKYTLSPSAQTNVAMMPGGVELVQSHLEITRANEMRIERVLSGLPINLTPENVDFYNSLQLGMAERHVVCPHADYGLANRWFQENVKDSGG